MGRTHKMKPTNYEVFLRTLEERPYTGDALVEVEQVYLVVDRVNWIMGRLSLVHPAVAEVLTASRQMPL